MAWVEDETWELEQGVDGLLTFELFADDAATTVWPFTGYDVNATISDLSGRTVYPVTVDANPAAGTVRLIALEATVAQLRPGRPYRYDCARRAGHHGAAGGPAGGAAGRGLPDLARDLAAVPGGVGDAGR